MFGLAELLMELLAEQFDKHLQQLDGILSNYTAGWSTVRTQAKDH